MFQIEENILERYAWEENSVLYEALKNAGDKVPSCENVCGAPPVQTDVPLTFPPGTILSPIMQRPVYKVSGDKIVGYRKSNIVVFVFVSFRWNPTGCSLDFLSLGNFDCLPYTVTTAVTGKDSP